MPASLTVFIIILSALMALYIALAFGIALYSVRPRRRSEAELAQEELVLKQVKPELYDIPFEQLHIKSGYGYDIYARGYFEFPNSHKYAVLAHGHNAASSGVVRFMEIFRNRGINTLCPDHRYSAKTGGRSISFGYYEKYDVISCIDYIYAKDPMAEIGIFGESMGAAISIMVAALRPDLKFCIEYCGYSAMEGVLKDTIRRIASPALIAYPLIKAFMPLAGGFKVKDVNPAADAKNIKMPVLMLHSRADTSVKFYHRDIILKNLLNGADIVEFESSEHGLSLNTYPERFVGGVNAFLDKIAF